MRNVAVPMSYLYGIKFVGPITPLTLALRQVRPRTLHKGSFARWLKLMYTD